MRKDRYHDDETSTSNYKKSYNGNFDMVLFRSPSNSGVGIDYSKISRIISFSLSMYYNKTTILTICLYLGIETPEESDDTITIQTPMAHIALLDSSDFKTSLFIF